MPKSLVMDLLNNERDHGGAMNGRCVGRPTCCIAPGGFFLPHPIAGYSSYDSVLAPISRMNSRGHLSKGFMMAGLSIGAAIDAIVIVAMTNSLNESCNASCKDAVGLCSRSAN